LYAPVLKPSSPVAVSVTGSGARVLVQATDGVRVLTSAPPEPLAALAELGVCLSGEPRTLVVTNRDTLSALLELATAIDPASDHAEVAAVVSWWAQRADHPGSSAVLNVTTACASRWVLGVPPAAERHIEVWRQWVGIANTGSEGLLQLAAAASAGRTLPGLETFAQDDRASWESFCSRMSDASLRWDWRTRDSRREAALGLASRCDAAELYESVRLGDPLVAPRESFSGSVVTGLISALPSRSVVMVTLDRLACRLRDGAAVEGYPGYPRDLPATGQQTPCVRGLVGSSRVTTLERLVLTISDAALRPPLVRTGLRITLRPRLVDPRQQRSGRQELHRRYAVRRSWLSGGPPPTPRRRDVPLDVAIAAAE
jgi:hypothetical protein